MKCYIISDTQDEKVTFLQHMAELLEKKGNNRAVCCVYNDVDQEFILGKMNEAPNDLFMAAAHIQLLALRNYGDNLIDYINGGGDDDGTNEDENDDGKENE